MCRSVLIVVIKSPLLLSSVGTDGIDTTNVEYDCISCVTRRV